jgi:hypothetical protein
MFRFEKDKSCLMPIDLFAIEVDIPCLEQKSIKMKDIVLPTFPELFYQEAFADVGLYYNSDGIGGKVHVDAPFSSSEYPDFSKGDALELLISTKESSHATSVTRFCHHFVIFPVEIGNFYAKEITHFRHDDTRALFDPSPIKVTSEFEKKSYSFDFFIPKSSLYGFDDMTAGFNFTYFIHNVKKGVQSFSASQENFTVSQMPSMWAYGVLQK